MARARQAPTPGQLTLEDWARTLDHLATAVPDRQPPTVAPVVAGTADTREVAPDASTRQTTDPSVRRHPLPNELLAVPEAMLTRTRLRELGLERRAVDAVFRALPVVALPGYSRPMVRVDDFRELVESYTFRDDRVRPMA